MLTPDEEMRQKSSSARAGLDFRPDFARDPRDVGRADPVAFYIRRTISPPTIPPARRVERERSKSETSEGEGLESAKGTAKFSGRGRPPRKDERSRRKNAEKNARG